MCVTDGILRARLDGELAAADLDEVEHHLAGCEKCRRRAEAIDARAARVGAAFAGLGSGDGPADSNVAFARVRARAADVPAQSWLARLFPARPAPAWGAVAAVALAVVLLTSGSARAAAQRLLGLFRVKSVVVVPLEGNIVADGKGDIIGKLLAESTVVTKKERPQPAANREEAGRLAGFTVRLPAMRQDAPRITVEGEHAFHLTVDLPRVQTLVAALGLHDVKLPPALHNAKVVVDIPRAVAAVYGECPKQTDCVVVFQIPAPTVVTLPDLDLNELAVAGLQMAGMRPEEALAFSRAVDWTSTLAIPVPRNVASHETVTVNGVQGVLLTGPSRYALIWIKDGVIYSVSGVGNPAVAVPLAESMS